MTNLQPLFEEAAATIETKRISVEGAKKVTFLFARSEHDSGSSTFSVDVSLDGETFVAYNKLIDNVVNTNSQNIARVASKALAADGSAIVSMDLKHDCFRFIKVKAVKDTDGKHSAKALIES